MNGFWNLEWKWEEVLQPLQIQSNLCGPMIISLNFTFRDFNAKLKFYAVILKLGQN